MTQSQYLYFLVVSLGSKNFQVIDNNSGKWYLYFPPKTYVMEEKILYTSLNFIAEIGGYIGLIRNIFWITLLIIGYLMKILRNGN